MPCLPSPKFHHHFYRWYGNPIPSRGWFMTLFYPHWISIVFGKDFRKAPDSGWKMAQAPLHFLPPWAWPDGEDTMHLMAKTPEKVSCREPSSFLWENANISQTYLKLPTSTNIYQPGRDFFTSKSLKFGNRYCTLRTCCLIHQSWRSPKIRQVKPLTFGLQSFFFRNPTVSNVSPCISRSAHFLRAEDLVLVGLLLWHPGEELCVALAVLEAAGSVSDLGEVEATNMECGAPIVGQCQRHVAKSTNGFKALRDSSTNWVYWSCYNVGRIWEQGH